MKRCPRCDEPVDGQKKYCSDSCKYWYNKIRKEKEAHLPPVKKRTNWYFSMITGYGVAKMPGARQGKRSGGMITGSMSARVNCTNEEWAEVNYDNIKRHFTCISFYRPTGITLGDQTWIREKDIQKVTGVVVDF